MKKTACILALMLIGCASPAADYVLAEKAAWDQFDAAYDSTGHQVQGPPIIDKWIDQEPNFPADLKDSLHQLNVGRRARVSHAVAAIKS